MDFPTALTTLAPSIVAIATLLFAYFQNQGNNKHQFQQQREQWDREEKKALADSEAVRARQLKDQLQEIYANAIRSLSEVAITSTYSQMSTANAAPQPKELGEAQKWASLFLIYYEGKKDDTRFEQFYNNLMQLSAQKGDQHAEPLRRYIIDVAMNDPRLK